MTIILDNEDFEWLKVLANHVPDEEEDVIIVEQLRRHIMADKKEKEVVRVDGDTDRVVVIPNTDPPIVVVPTRTSYQHIRSYEQPC